LHLLKSIRCGSLLGQDPMFAQNGMLEAIRINSFNNLDGG